MRWPKEITLIRSGDGVLVFTTDKDTANLWEPKHKRRYILAPAPRKRRKATQRPKS